VPKGKNETSRELSRRGLLRQAVATGTAFGALSAGMPSPLSFVQTALAAEHPPVGTWPDGASGSSVTVGIAVPRTGTYAE
jgi:branched-chain amino acid transport system substrate-binding protein